MSRRIDLKHIGTLPQALAHVALVRAMRHYMKAGAPFVASFVVEDAEQVGVYENMAEALLLRRDPDGIRRARDKASVTTFEGGKVTTANIKGNLHSFRQVVFIFDGMTPVPPEVRATSDIYQVFGKPDASLIQSAFAVFYRGNLTEVEAELIAKSDWTDLATLFRSGRSIGQSFTRLKSLAELPSTEGSGVDDALENATSKLQALHGYGEATHYALELAKDFASYRAGIIGWNDIERGLLLYGPPGTGKTSFARRLAEACGVPLVTGSYSEWQSHGHQGDMLKAMRKCMMQATSLAPCILLIDELGAFTTRNARTNNAEYMIGVVNGLLELLDGINGREGVVVIATANEIADIDPAVLRAGRIDTHIEISPPDAHARCAILEEYLDWKLPPETRSLIADRTEGLTGADLELVAKAARRRRRDNPQDPMSIDLVISCLPEVIQISAEKLRVAAVHESGHALLGLLCGRTVRSMFVKDSLVVGSTPYIGQVEYETQPDLRFTSDVLLTEIMIRLAGMAAEIEVFGAHDWGSGGRKASDLALATDLATRYEAVLGMGSTLVSEVAADDNYLARIRQQNPIIFNRIDAVLKSQFAKARSLVAEHKTVLIAMAEHLAIAKSMSGAEVLQFLKSIEFDIAAHAHQAIAADRRMQCDSGSSPISTLPSRMLLRLFKFLRRMFVWSRATSM
jgi:ATP-dependent Zn protease